MRFGTSQQPRHARRFRQRHDPRPCSVGRCGSPRPRHRSFPQCSPAGHGGRRSPPCPRCRIHRTRAHAACAAWSPSRRASASRSARPRSPTIHPSATSSALFRRGPRQRERRSRSSLGSGFLIGDGHIVTNIPCHRRRQRDSRRLPGSLLGGTARPGRPRSRTDIAVLKLDEPVTDQPRCNGAIPRRSSPAPGRSPSASPFGLGGPSRLACCRPAPADINAGPTTTSCRRRRHQPGNSGARCSTRRPGDRREHRHRLADGRQCRRRLRGPVQRGAARGRADHRTGRVERGFIGITLQPLTPASRRPCACPNANGALVAQVERGRRQRRRASGPRCGHALRQPGYRQRPRPAAPSGAATARRARAADYPARGPALEVSVTIGRRDGQGGTAHAVGAIQRQCGGLPPPWHPPIVPIEEGIRRAMASTSARPACCIQRVEPAARPRKTACAAAT